MEVNRDKTLVCSEKTQSGKVRKASQLPAWAALLIANILERSWKPATSPVVSSVHLLTLHSFFSTARKHPKKSKNLSSGLPTAAAVPLEKWSGSGDIGFHTLPCIRIILCRSDLWSVSIWVCCWDISLPASAMTKANHKNRPGLSWH